MSQTHLIILRKHYIDLLLKGQKTIESRFSKTRKAPFQQVCHGDRVYFKRPSGPVTASATVGKVQFISNLTPARMQRLKEEYNNEILAPNEYWQQKTPANYATLIWFKNIQAIPPFRITKKDSRAWVVCDGETLIKEA